MERRTACSRGGGVIPAGMGTYPETYLTPHLRAPLEGSYTLHLTPHLRGDIPYPPPLEGRRTLPPTLGRHTLPPT